MGRSPRKADFFRRWSPDMAYVLWSTSRAKCLAAWLYVENPGLALDRKAAIAADFIVWQPRKRPHAGTITQAMKLRFAAYLPPEE